MIGEYVNRLRGALRAGVKAAAGEWRSERFPPATGATLSAVMLEATRVMRGARPPAILLHGVMPRSGTVYLGRLLRHHPDLYAYPNEIWEMPLLRSVPAVRALQASFISGYRKNRDRFAPDDFLALVGTAFIAYLHSQTPPGKRLLMKVPLASHLAQFDLMFPHEQCLMLMRDGRDLTASTLKTWPGRDFGQVARGWSDAANYLLSLDHPCYRYEDIVADPAASVRAICERVGLDPDRYPYAAIPDQPLKGSSDFAQEQGWKAVAKPASFRSVGRWSEWSAQQKAQFKRVAGPALIRAGYATDDNW